MTDISEFPTLPLVHDTLIRVLGPTDTFTASGAILAGQAVCYASDGEDFTVLASVAGSGTRFCGVALADAASGAKVAVALPGCIVEMANADDTTAIDAGDWVECNDNAVKGTINAVAFTNSGALALAHPHVVGFTLEGIAGGSAGYVMIWPCIITEANTS